MNKNYPKYPTVNTKAQISDLPDETILYAPSSRTIWQKFTVLKDLTQKDNETLQTILRPIGSETYTLPQDLLMEIIWTPPWVDQ